MEINSLAISSICNMMKKMRKIELQTIVWKEGRHWVAQCLNIDVSSFGRSKQAAINNLEEAVELYLEDYRHRIQDIRSPSIIVRELQHA